ncbi:hypothetical protein [Pseudoalteromonas sp. MMG012]|uniref:hypothetical protein n=1 Tax=Pseudoalteromonas sp. MMG012 TaxID=2822686 RepID=UPI001B3A3D10|nr:hypothetical protein [Pseudoalteromonas sp. MMG012]MBQ4850820.1 hypothetical protein [Pseudoalteromonas sp. MMG012]
MKLVTGIICGVFLGYMFWEGRMETTVKNENGVVYIPILDSCLNEVETIGNWNILSYELMKFGMKTGTENVNTFLKIERSGSVADLLTVIHQNLIKCIPNMQVKYSNSNIFQQDINELFEVSKESEVMIRIQGGEATAYFNNKK